MRGTNNPRAKGEEGSILVIALLLMVLLSLLGLTLLTVASTEYSIGYNALWSEGALSAADAGVNMGVNQIGANPTTSVLPINLRYLPDTVNGPYNYRSGPRGAGGPQPLQFVNTRVEPGYSIAVGTGYNPSGYAFFTYQINATGVGPRNAQREVEVQAEYGPVAQ
jgi:Tfp pilus assembly protein PilX